MAACPAIAVTSSGSTGGRLLAAQGLQTVGRGTLPRMGGSVQVVVSRRVPR
jgi:hypothetical protein